MDTVNSNYIGILEFDVMLKIQWCLDQKTIMIRYIQTKYWIEKYSQTYEWDVEKEPTDNLPLTISASTAYIYQKRYSQKWPLKFSYKYKNPIFIYKICACDIFLYCRT